MEFLLSFFYEIRKSKNDAFCSSPGLVGHDLHVCLFFVRTSALEFLRSSEIERRIKGKVASACQCVLACDQLLFQSKLN